MAYQSLYRRYRPRRFAELRGQDHVVRTLRNAVREDRVGHAYLFSGPRGTGKTSTARILAKVLNCEAPEDGEPCCRCPSCLAVEAGSSFDVHELDAASNNGVDAIRDLIEKAALGSPGRTKVYILDEVHMLSRGAEAALLKTLEEPPAHVVFVLATTDPHKVSETIRSRTQSLEFHLLPMDDLAEHVRWVVRDAGLEIDEPTIEAVLRQGRGSARDTLSALEIAVAAGGLVSDDEVMLDEVLDALVHRDTGRAVAAVAAAMASGRDARVLTEQLVGRLRDAFLALVAPELVALPGATAARVAEQAHRLGTAATVRAIEALGQLLVDVRNAPDPRLLLDVVLVRLTRDDADVSVQALLERVERLERQLAAGGGAGGRGPAEPAAAPAVAAGPAPRATLGSAAPRRPAERAPERPAEPEAVPAPAAAGSSAGAGGLPSHDELVRAWSDLVLPRLTPLTRALFQPGRFLASDGATAVLGLPNKPHRDKCEAKRAEVEGVLAAHFGRPVPLRLVVDGGPTGGGGASAGAGEPAEAAPAAAPPAEPGRGDRSGGGTRRLRVVPTEPEPSPVDELPDHVDADELAEAVPATAVSALDRLTAAFPGSEVVPTEPDALP